jgi:3D (Asp-Asp-Asp) domain-containing protein
VNFIAAFLITMSVTAYAPDAGGINGNGVITADGSVPTTGHAACGSRYPFGTVFEFVDDVRPYGLPQVVECRDRGGYIGNHNLDVVIKSGDVKRDLALAREWGKRRIKVRVFANWAGYLEHLQAEYARRQATVMISAPALPESQSLAMSPIE